MKVNFFPDFVNEISRFQKSFECFAFSFTFFKIIRGQITGHIIKTEKTMGKKTFWVIIILIAVFSACSKLLPSMINPEQGLCGPVDGMSNKETILFAKGNDAFFANRTMASGLALIS